MTSFSAFRVSKLGKQNYLILFKVNRILRIQGSANYTIEFEGPQQTKIKNLCSSNCWIFSIVEQYLDLRFVSFLVADKWEAVSICLTHKSNLMNVKQLSQYRRRRQQTFFFNWSSKILRLSWVTTFQTALNKWHYQKLNIILEIRKTYLT